MRYDIMPVDDLILHERGDGCVCRPDTEFVPGGVIQTHHPLHACGQTAEWRADVERMVADVRRELAERYG